ncbi:hypothetical protein GOP56_03345 [Brevibacillus sp. 7WMA2]|uniref:hypothetical protein n=1 Tax=Brevibacillus TaxID=55080 RepID=UPI000BD668FE|nr:MULTISPECIES: hypothetical protein [Brevibacillus]MDF9411390.1 hypothetical protein [Brevibacillus laterosporus]PCN45985.1 hypothetical protein B9C88_00170 [Brevibacillus laterosporus]QIC04725.1 hypothetical protein GOP56_03345 [Brevibacillus sp. 7WMA2]
MLARYVVGGRLDPPYYPTKTRAHFIGRDIYVKGMRSSGTKRVITDTFHLSHDVELYAISIKSDIITPSDYWNLLIGNKLIAKNIYCKNFEEGLYFQVAHPIKAGTICKLEFYTEAGDRKQIEVMFHLLCDPEAEPILTGTVDNGNYPDPLPPDPVPVPIPDDDDTCKNPIVWKPYATAAEAEKWCNSINIDANFHRNIYAANYVTEGLVHLLNHCCGFKTMITKHKLTINIKDAKGANGYFNPPTGEVVVNKKYDFANADKIALAEYQSGQKSSPHKLRTIIHEIGHWLHFHNVGADQFYQFSALDPDNYGPKTILSYTEATYIANHLCSYATSWYPIELIPEAFTAKVTDIPIDPKIQEWYQQYGGYECNNWKGG